jgi:hypothetical protein
LNRSGPVYEFSYLQVITAHSILYLKEQCAVQVRLTFSKRGVKWIPD